MYNVPTRYIYNQQKPGHSLGKKIKVGIVSQNKEQTKKLHGSAIAFHQA